MTKIQRTGVRRYNKSGVARLRWTPELHHRFVQAVQRLGGKYKATPKQIWKMMRVEGLKMSHVKSHLQTYRSTKDGSTFNGLLQATSHPHFDDVGIFQRQLCNDFREHQHESRIFCQERSESLPTREDTYEYQDTHISTVSEISKDENVDGPNRSFDQLLPALASSALMQSKKAREFWPLDDYKISSTSIEETQMINLDLTISTFQSSFSD